MNGTNKYFANEVIAGVMLSDFRISDQRFLMILPAVSVMARYCFVFVLLVLNGCNVLDEAGPSGAIRITNHSSEAILPVAIELELSRLIDIYPLSPDDFRKNKYENGQSIDLLDIDNYERGDDIQLIVWRELREGKEPSNPDEIATLDVKYYELGSKALRHMNYHIEIKK